MTIRQFNPECMFLCMRWPDEDVAADSMMFLVYLFLCEWQRCSSVKVHVPLIGRENIAAVHSSKTEGFLQRLSKF